MNLLAALGRLLLPVGADAALKSGATHHGYFWFMPVWLAPEREAIMAKWPPMDVLVWLFASASIMLTGGLTVWTGPAIEGEN